MINDTAKRPATIADQMIASEEANPKKSLFSPKSIFDALEKYALASKPKDLLLMKTANQSMQESSLTPIPNMLFGKFFYEGELCVLFADTNVGKSILAVQIADSISSGRAIEGFELTAKKQPVLYFDFELSDKQFEARYSNSYTNHYRFDSSLYRITINPDADIVDENEFNKSICRKMEQYIQHSGSKVIIIDNITYLNVENEKSYSASRLMQYLKQLKSSLGLSMLVLAHTPKRDPAKQLSKNDLQGSRMMMNFYDSAFAIGESQTTVGIRYLKQLKMRNVEHIYHSENVCVCQLEKPSNFLRFTFLGYGSEYEHLRQPTESSRTERDAQIMELHKQGLSSRTIAGQVSLSHTAVSNIIKRLAKPEPDDETAERMERV